MKIKSLPVLLAAALLMAAPPAFAKIALSKGEKLCETAAKAQTPAPQSVRADSDQTLANDQTATYLLRVKQADGTSAKLSCTVNRETEEVKLAAL
jgi:hypothetical protein